MIVLIATRWATAVTEIVDPNEITTRIYPYNAPYQLPELTADQFKKQFQERGIEFPEGTGVAVDETCHTVVVTHRNSAQERIRAIFESWNPTPPQVTIQVQMIHVARGIAAELFGEPLGTGHVLNVKAETLKQLRALVKDKKAAVICQPQVATVSGNTAQVKSVQEVRFSVGYDDESDPKKTAGAISVTPSGRYFETREVGTLLNVTPTVGPDGRTINLTLVPEYTTVSRPYRKIEVPLPKSGKAVTVESPEFTSLQITTTVQIQSGNTLLLAVLEPTPSDSKEVHDSVILVLVTSRYGSD